MEQFNKFLILLSLILYNNINAQEEQKFFITKDTLTMENPVIISFKNADGMFLTSENYIKNKKKIDIKKMITEGKAYIFSDEFYRFLSLKELELKPIYKSCYFVTSYDFLHHITVRKLDNSANRFLLCFIRLDFYHKKILTQNHKKKNFSNERISNFYKIVFPICE